MAAVTIFISIDPSLLTYTGYTPGLIPAAVNYDPVSQMVGIVWTSTNPTNINGTLVTLNFTYKGGNGDLVFQEGCDFQTILFQQIIPAYDNGSAGPLASIAYHVDGAVVSTGNGLSWTTPFKTIGEATSMTLKAGDSVLVKPGTYAETVNIRSNGKEIVPVKYNVSVSDTNKITFPTGTDLGCIDLDDHAGQFYAYVYRSWKCNNGVYKILQVNTEQRYVIVENAAFKSESGAVSDTSLLQASIGQPVFYLKYTTTPETQRVIVKAASVPAVNKSVCYIGTPSVSGDDVTAPANYNLVDGWDLTANTGLAGLSGLRIVGSKFNVYRNSWIYELDSMAVFLMGNSTTSHPCNYNMILGNKVYNTKARGLKIGIHNGTGTTNAVQFTLFKGNELYSSGAGANINFQNAVDIHKNTSFTVIEKNTIRNFNLKTAGKGAVEIWDYARKSLVYGNFLKNVGKLTSGTNSLIYVRNNNNNINVYNNVLRDSLVQNTDIYAFRLNGNYSVSNRVVFNTIYNIDNGILFEDTGLPATVDFKLQDNIIYINSGIGGVYFTHAGGTTGRFTVSYNCYPTTPTLIGQPYHLEPGRQVGDPLFLNPSFSLSAAGLSLLPGSICINNGTTVSGIANDYLNRARSITTPAIGAFEGQIVACAWTGTAGQGWHNYKNWDILYIPTEAMSALIPDRVNDPLVSTSNAVCKSLQLQPGAQLRIRSPRTLTVYE